jgi:UDP:flavonoid glycosyltransferase YjiC (YdhE family)
MSEASKKCLLVTYGGGHVALMCPLAQAMMSKGYTVKILALTTAQAYLKQRGIPFVGYSDMPESKAQDVQEYGRALAGEMGQAQKIDFAETVAYLGLNYKDLAWKMVWWSGL